MAHCDNSSTFKIFFFRDSQCWCSFHRTECSKLRHQWNNLKDTLASKKAEKYSTKSKEAMAFHTLCPKFVPEYIDSNRTSFQDRLQNSFGHSKLGKYLFSTTFCKSETEDAFSLEVITVLSDPLCTMETSDLLFFKTYQAANYAENCETMFLT